MKYRESLFLRKRLFHLDKFGIKIEDSSLFRTVSRFIKLEDISPKYNYYSESILDKMIMSISLLVLSIYIFIKHNSDIVFLIVAVFLGLFSLYVISDIIKNSKYIGTLSFDNIQNRNKGKLYFKTKYPLDNDLINFIAGIRKYKIDREFENIIYNNIYEYQKQFDIVTDKMYQGYTKSYFIRQLIHLKTKLFLTDEEFNLLEKKLKLFFTENNIPDAKIHD